MIVHMSGRLTSPKGDADLQGIFGFYLIFYQNTIMDNERGLK